MNKNKIIFFLIWIALLSVAPITLLLNTPLSLLTKNMGTIAVGAQRLFGLWVFTLMFVQIVLGSFMSRLADRFGGWIFNFHVLEGILIYFLILVHGSAYVVFRYLIGQGLDPFYVFVDVCVLCGRSTEFYYNFGRLAFWSVTLAVSAGYFRMATPFLRAHWRKFHILNYVAFLLVAIHSFFLGTDILVQPFLSVYVLSLITVLGIIVYKGYKYIISVIE